MKDLRKTLKMVLIQIISELPEGGMIHSSKEGRMLVLSRLGVLDEGHWGVYDRGVSAFANNLSSVVHELKKKGLLSIPKPMYWGRPSVQVSLFGEDNVKKDIEIISSDVGSYEEVEIKKEESDGLTMEERMLKKLVDLKGDVVLSQAVRDIGGWYSDGGCYGGYGSFSLRVCEGGLNGSGKMLKSCPLRSFCKKESGF